ncbi:MAG: hypothetical protein GOMPHAMPRED_006662 [Gomphillus americanus]|uniref:RNA polymerase I-specific transcription initiation factor RRN3 n=1 Tax=Gomphillus americanus TaxID=1940652 RepID=A0A8H3FXT3_9LECA|nr:MAG: hypothetical protein GOMPHAMPRED_006662 [Gomphillus americanus]
MVSISISTHPLGNEVTSNTLGRRPTLVRKFAEANLGADKDVQAPLGPAKRTKVAFNNEVEINMVEDWDRPPELTREEVRRALERHRNGDSSSYETLKKVFTAYRKNEMATDSSTLRQYTAALLSNISLVDRSCSDLVQLVFKVDWAGKDDAYVALYQRLVGNLVLSQGTWLNPALHMLVGHFLQVLGHTAGFDQVTPHQIRSRVHATLHNIVKLIPSASQSLAHILGSRFPHMLESKRTHVRYVHNLLQIIDYAPELRSEICSLVMDRVVKIDVQVQVDIDDLNEEIGEKIVQDVLQSTEDIADDSASDDSDVSEAESDVGSEHGAEPVQSEERRAKEIAANIDKLDLLLDMTFKYFTTLFANPITQEAALDMLLSHFTSTILPSYQSRHTQFLLFHFAQTSPELMDIFIGILVRTTSDQTKAPLIRQTAASYLASFVARGKHVPASIVRDVFDYLSVQLSQLRAQHMPDYRGPDPRRYSTYYALSQVLMYVFCFRWRDLLLLAHDDVTPPPSSRLYATGHDDVIDEHPTFLPGVKETLLLHCFKGLNPLKVCSPAIVAEFAQITRHLGLLYIYPYLESNKRVRIVHNVPVDHRETALTNLKSNDSQGSDAYFPFDPYKLPRSKKWLEGDYRDWQPLPGFDDQEQDDSDSEVDENEESDVEDTATDEDDE